MEIIKASEVHIPIIQSLSDIVWPLTFKNILTAEQIPYMLDMMYSTASLKRQMGELGHHYILVRQESEYLGYLSYELNYKGSRITKIHKIYVLPSVQGKGLGRFFIEFVEEFAKKNNDIGLSLNVNRFNKAIDFYKRIGFEVVSTEDIDIGNGFLMEDYVLNKIFDI